MLDSNIPRTSIRPGVGVPQGAVTSTSAALSAFIQVRPTPAAAALGTATYLEWVRINISWVTAAFDGFQIVFGPSDAAIQAANFVGAPVFTQAMGVQKFTLLQTDIGFKVQPTGTASDTLSYWIG